MAEYFTFRMIELVLYRPNASYLDSGTLIHLALTTSLKVAIYSKGVIGKVQRLFQIKQSISWGRVSVRPAGRFVS